MKKLLNILLVLTCAIACVFVMSSCTSTTTCASHTDMDSNGLCDVCGTSYTCPGHADVNGDGMCDFCLATFSCSFHLDANADEKCDVCGVAYTCPDHTDTDGDEVCDTCGAEYVCPGHCDVDRNGFCDECEIIYVCPGHEDADADHHCDICKTPWACTAHKDSDGDGKCDYCKAKFKCSGHVDAGSDGRCDKCDGAYTCPGHKDDNGDNVCDVCTGYYKAPVDFRSEFTSAAKATDPTVLVVTVKTTEIDKGTLESTYTVTFAEDGSFAVTGTKQSFNESFTGDLIISTPVSITCDADGNYSDGGEFVGSNPAATGVTIDFSKLKNYNTPNATTLNATVAKADTSSVFGVAFDSDVTLLVNKAESEITFVSLIYANVQITCAYN